MHAALKGQLFQNWPHHATISVRGETQICGNLGFASISPDLREMLRFAQMAEFITC
jgi:hypothetical protein